ncbi:MAG: hypothetical protein ERJ67_08505 [Aphanocapsa feldmannii 277cV]|uniref:Uncharacterized protein n=1 Tax=Aphanocapsa feldmannii 277cV TaxID=2507553 RepID=A0A524RM25_9CHRO|nr:MAG: hypothetical protein ERJ69_04235 [Aphanocapsa feldmannii 288cV]TGG91205.1 MAG: hypothetical protein ERJ67_08505 [Aphanocapsa feldmannii 277cV]
MPKPLVELYGLLAVLLVIVPEWMAAALIDNLDPTKGARLTPRSAAWRHDPELVLAELNLMQLRQLARTLGLPTYAADHRERLTRRLLKRLRKGWGHTQIL